MCRRCVQKLGAAVASGQSLAKTSRDIRERFNVGKYYADRLIRTETNYFAAAGEMESYKSMGIKQYQFLATLDKRTSQICRELDGKVFDVADAEPGLNIHPMHPNCRSTTTAYFGKEWEPDERIARNPLTGKNYKIGNMNYAEWEKAFVKDEKTSVVSSLVQNLGASTAGIIASRLSFLADSCPQTKGAIEGVQVLATNLPASQYGKTVYNKRTYDTARVEFSQSKFTDLNALEAKLKSMMASGYSAMSNAGVNYVVDHEFGHVLENYIMQKTGKNAQKIQDEILRITAKDNNITAEEAFSLTSRYGKENPQDFFAETFASLIGGVPTIVASALQKYIMEIL